MSRRTTGRRAWFGNGGIAAALALLFALAAPGAAKGGEMSLTLTSNSFQPDGEIPTRYTCEGQDVSPELSWSGAPAGTRSFALIVDDPDAPDPRAPKTTWVHWVLYNLPADAATSTSSSPSTSSCRTWASRRRPSCWRRWRATCWGGRSWWGRIRRGGEGVDRLSFSRAGLR